jgi:hypothetical protein
VTDHERDLLVDRYLLALIQGDIDDVASVLASALDDPELDRLITEMNAALDEEPPRHVGALTLKEYGSLIKGKICRWCRARLNGWISHYDHCGGWKVTGFPQKQWLYTTCPRCKYQWNLGKLGIHR